jgi:hypothetical protein
LMQYTKHTPPNLLMSCYKANDCKHAANFNCFNYLTFDFRKNVAGLQYNFCRFE